MIIQHNAYSMGEGDGLKSSTNNINNIRWWMTDNIVNRNNNSNHTDNRYKDVICLFFVFVCTITSFVLSLFFHSRALSRALLNFKVTSSFRLVITILHY